MSYTQGLLLPQVSCPLSPLKKKNLPLTPLGFQHSWNFTTDLTIQNRPKQSNSIEDLSHVAI